MFVLGRLHSSPFLKDSLLHLRYFVETNSNPVGAVRMGTESPGSQAVFRKWELVVVFGSIAGSSWLKALDYWESGLFPKGLCKLITLWAKFVCGRIWKGGGPLGCVLWSTCSECHLEGSPTLLAPRTWCRAMTKIITLFLLGAQGTQPPRVEVEQGI